MIVDLVGHRGHSERLVRPLAGQVVPFDVESQCDDAGRASLGHQVLSASYLGAIFSDRLSVELGL